MLRSVNHQLRALFVVQVPESRQDMLADFLSALFKLYIDLNFVYMEINPIVVVEGRITPLDMAAKIDETASFLCGPKWGEIDFPAPFGEKAVGHDCCLDQSRVNRRYALEPYLLYHT